MRKELPLQADVLYERGGHDEFGRRSYVGRSCVSFCVKAADGKSKTGVFRDLVPTILWFCPIH